MNNYIIAICLVACTSVYSQVSIWISPGVNYSNLDPRLFDPLFAKQEKQNLNFTYFPYLGIGLECKISNSIIKSGLFISQRGSNFNTRFPLFPDKYFKVTYTFLEVPFLFAYEILQPNIGAQLGVVFNKRLETNSVEYDERNRLYALDLRTGIFFRPVKKIQFDLNYTIGNFDKIVWDIRNNYVHQVFSLGISYRILTFDKKRH